MLDDKLEQFTYVAIRFGDSAFYARGADGVIGFEYPGSAMLFSDMHRRNTDDDLRAAEFEDFEDVAMDAGTYIKFETDAFEGTCVLALPAWCSVPENLRGAADSLTWGWGALNPRIVSFDVME